jgi:hypothetical protein
MLKVEVWRNHQSYNFKADRTKPDSFENNWKNNSLDLLMLCDTDTSRVLFQCKCQSVANYCFGKERPGDTVSYGDTIAVGKFTLRCFVSPREFHGEIHAIINATDMDGQCIDHNAMQLSADGFQNGRWLIHDRYSSKTGRDTNYAWSAGCIILSSADLVSFNAALRAAGVSAGDELPGEIVENSYDKPL